MCEYSTAGEGDVWGRSKGLRGVVNIGQLILSMGPVGAKVGILALKVHLHEILDFRFLS